MEGGGTVNLLTTAMARRRAASSAARSSSRSSARCAWALATCVVASILLSYGCASSGATSRVCTVLACGIECCNDDGKLCLPCPPESDPSSPGTTPPTPTPPSSSKDSGWKADTAWIAVGQGADLAYTEYALSSVPGAYEANPLMKNQGVRFAVKAAVIAGGSALCRHYREKGEPKKAKAVRWVLFSAGVVAVSISAYQIHGR